MITMNKSLTILPLVLLAFTACGKKGGSAGGASGDAAIEQVLSTVLDPEEAELPVEEASDGLPVDLALGSNRCFSSRLNSNGLTELSRTRIQLLESGVGHIWVTSYSDSECSVEASREHILFRYDVVRVDDGVHLLRLTGFGVSEELGTLWLTVRRTQDGAVYDIDAIQEGSGPYLEAPEQETSARLLDEELGVHFTAE